MVVPKKAKLSRHIAGLNQTDRYILLLAYAEKMTCREIALVLQLTEQDVRRRLDDLKEEARRFVGSAPTNALSNASSWGCQVFA